MLLPATPHQVPPSRPSFDVIYMNLAVALSARSTCRRLSVGCVIVSADYQRVLSVGYNGNSRGLANDCDSDVPGQCGDIHAEANAIIKCREPAETAKIVYVTNLPCKMCAKMLVNLGGVHAVRYLADYRIRDSLLVFEQAGISCQQFDPEAP